MGDQMSELRKPAPNKPCFRMFPEMLELIRAGKCPDCKKILLKDGAGKLWFRDRLSKEEYSISGLCQACQDLTWPEGREEE